MCVSLGLSVFLWQNEMLTYSAWEQKLGTKTALAPAMNENPGGGNTTLGLENSRLFHILPWLLQQTCLAATPTPSSAPTAPPPSWTKQRRVLCMLINCTFMNSFRWEALSAAGSVSLYSITSLTRTGYRAYRDLEQNLSRENEEIDLIKLLFF